MKKEELISVIEKYERAAYAHLVRLQEKFYVGHPEEQAAFWKWSALDSLIKDLKIDL